MNNTKYLSRPVLEVRTACQKWDGGGKMKARVGGTGSISDAELDEIFVQLSDLPTPLKEEVFVGLCLAGTFSTGFAGNYEEQ